MTIIRYLMQLLLIQLIFQLLFHFINFLMLSKTHRLACLLLWRLYRRGKFYQRSTHQQDNFQTHDHRWTSMLSLEHCTSSPDQQLHPQASRGHFRMTSDREVETLFACLQGWECDSQCRSIALTFASVDIHLFSVASGKWKYHHYWSNRCSCPFPILNSLAVHVLLRAIEFPHRLVVNATLNQLKLVEANWIIFYFEEMNAVDKIVPVCHVVPLVKWPRSNKTALTLLLVSWYRVLQPAEPPPRN